MTQKRNSQLCPQCRKLISKSAPECPFCGLAKPASPSKNIFASGSRLFDDTQPVTVLIALNVVMFVFSILLNPHQVQVHFSPFAFLSVSNDSLLILGATGTIPIFQLERYWTLLAANYLHGGFLHIVFNMLAVRQLAPIVIREFGINRMIIIYTLGGVVGFAISTFAGIRFTIGASAALCSLIGALLYYGKSRGGTYGDNLFSQVGGWALGIGLFGFMVPGINNWGHGGGLLGGLIIAYLVGYREKKRENLSHRVVSVICVIITATVLLWSLLNGFLYLLFR